MKSNVMLVVLVVLIGILSGLAFLVGINNTLQLAFAPVITHLNQIQANEKIIIDQLTGSWGARPGVIDRLKAIEDQLKTLESKISSAQPSFARPQAPQPPQPPQEDFNKVYAIEDGASPINGKKNAPVTIVQFTDLQCPFCARFYPPIEEVLKAYPDKVRFISKNFPLSFHPNARPAAKLALAANEQGKYFEMVKLLLQNGADVSESKVKEYAKELNIKHEKLISDLKVKDAEYEKRINDDIALAGQSDVMGTPTFFINGKKTVARDFNSYKIEIDKILSGK